MPGHTVQSAEWTAIAGCGVASDSATALFDTPPDVAGQRLPASHVDAQRRERLRMPARRRWHDRPDASGGDAPVHVNGRGLLPAGIAQLQQFVGAVAPGRCSLDAQGTPGIEGGTPLTTLLAVARAHIARSAPGGAASNTGDGTECANGGHALRTSMAGINGNESEVSGYVLGSGLERVLPTEDGP